MFENKETHPSYATLGFSRVSGGTTSLFGSSIQHNNTIVMTVRQGSIERSLSRDWIMGQDELLQVEMSYSQFAEAITSMNQGTGVPVTLKYLQGKGRIEDCPFIDKKEQFEDEFKNTIEKTNANVNSLIEEITTLFSDKKSMTKGDKENVLNKLNSIKQGIGSNSQFVYSQFNKQMDKTVKESKGEIEAFFQNKINSIVNTSLVQQKDELIKLENPISSK